jgi:hypothetical protein
MKGRDAILIAGCQGVEQHAQGQTAAAALKAQYAAHLIMQSTAC